MNTTYFLNLVGGNVFGKKATPSIPNTYYIGLSSTTPNIDGSGITEPVGGAYARVTLANTNATLTEPTNGVVANISDIVFPESTTNWGVMTHYLIYDGQAAGSNLLMYGTLTNTRTVEAATTVIIRQGQLQLQVSN